MELFPTRYAKSKLRVLLIMLVTFGCVAQESQNSGYAFKGNRLGESLDEFKAMPNNAVDLWINTGNPNAWTVDKKKNIHLEGPFCSDEYQSRGPSQVPYGSIVCTLPRAKSNDVNFIDASLIGDLSYSFYQKKLYKISMRSFSREYSHISAAFQAKYGTFAETTTETFTNAYGATWHGGVLVFRSGTQSILVREGSGNGPAQNDLNMQTGVSIVFTDSALSPPNAKPIINF